MIKVIIHGFNGKMGKVLQNIISDDPTMEIVAGIDPIDRESEFCPVYKSFSDCPIKADVIIDFSHFSAIPALIEHAVNTKTPAVICTTGLTEDVLNLIRDSSKSVALFRSSNMSLGINVLKKALEVVVGPLESNFNIEIIEKHHNKKVDSPSGTALLLADAINDSCKVKKDYIYGRHSKNDECKITDLGIHAVRGGTIPGEHIVIFAGPDEIIELKHTALSRNIFANGAVEAAKFLSKQKTGLYDMSHLFD
ncbi:MAG: 4-hydroxy-tetrahydrodipicolinate reductase [Peptostreptococcales bacterium]